MYACKYVYMYYACVCMYVCMHVCMYVGMFVYVFMYVCIYVCMYLLMYVCIYVCMHACKYVYMYYVCVYVCMHVCIYVCQYVCVCMYVCMYLCMYMHLCTYYVCLCVCVYIYIYIYIYICICICMLVCIQSAVKLTISHWTSVLSQHLAATLHSSIAPCHIAPCHIALWHIAPCHIALWHSASCPQNHGSAVLSHSVGRSCDKPNFCICQAVGFGTAEYFVLECHTFEQTSVCSHRRWRHLRRNYGNITTSGLLAVLTVKCKWKVVAVAGTAQ